MPRAKVVEFPLAPGEIADDTVLSTKFHASSTDKVRVRGQRYETIGGWDSFNAFGMSAGVPRSCHDYSDLDGNSILLAASANTLNAWLNGTRIDITPEYWKDVWIGKYTGLNNASTSVVAGPGPGQATIYWSVFTPATTLAEDAEHDLVVGDVVTVSMYRKGDSDTLDLNGTWPVIAVPTKYSFVVACPGTKLGIDSPAAPFRLTVAWRNGLTDGIGNTAAQKARVWSIDNFGENGVFVGSDGTPLFAWQPETESPNLIKDGQFNAAITPTGPYWYGLGWSNIGGTAQGGSGYMTQDISGAVQGGKVYEISYTMSNPEVGGFFSVKIDDIDIYPSDAINPPLPYIGRHTYRFVAPAAPTTLQFASSTIGDVSIRLVTKAFPINEAPQKSYAMFVDGNKSLNLLGTVGSSGVFDAQCMRWSDVGNYRTWVPDTDNTAGEFRLARGNYAVAGIDCGERTILLTDNAAYAAAFNGKGYTIKLMGRGCGGLGPRAIAAYNGRAFWPSQKGFYVFDGAQVVPLQTPIKGTFVNKIKTNQENKTYVWFCKEFGEAWFHWPHSDDPSAEPSRVLIFNLLESNTPWTEATLRRTCFTHGSAFQYPIAFSEDGSVWNHEKGHTMTGAEVLPFLETGYITAEAGDSWTGIRRWYPDIKDQVGNVLFTVTGKHAPQGAANEQVIGPIQVPIDKRVVDFLLSARQTKLKWSSEDVTNFWRMGTVGLEVIPGGPRR